ncbi:MAG: D-alanyl-D-alanine carboxypeptidase family protein [Oscillospiraceae bacterium]
MKKIKILPIILIICAVFSFMAPAALALDDPNVTAQAVVLADAASGRVFFSRDMDKKMYPASLTKIMTVLLAIEAVDRGDVSLYDEVTSSANSVVGMVEDGSTANIVPGEKMSLENLLYCAMVESANEACNIIAEYISGSVADFVKLMNDRAKALGCTGTHFVNTHGLPDNDHYTTAHDMYLITQEAISRDLFMEICNTVNYTVPATNFSDERKLSNTNGLINADSRYYRGCYYEFAKGVKTGHTSSAGYCLISTAEKEGMRFVCVVLGGVGTQNADGSMTYGNFVDTISMYNWVFNNFSVQEVLSSSELVREIDVSMGADVNSVTLRPKDVVTALLPNDEKVADFERRITIYNEQNGEELVAPIAAGQVLGEITVSKDGVVYGSTALVASTSVELSRMQYMKHQVKTALDLVWVKIIFWVLIIALAAYALLVIRYRILHKRHLKNARRVRVEREKLREAEDMTRVFRNTEETKAPPRAPSAPSEQKVEYFAPDDGKTRQPISPDTEQKDRDKARRDYFEEFFRRREEEQNSDNSKK